MWRRMQKSKCKGFLEGNKEISAGPPSSSRAWKKEESKKECGKEKSREESVKEEIGKEEVDVLPA